ncbi:MAG: hypothetical protein KDI31_03535 [Pseudomonadales bacterium]|nr:hypothetical protein [Pseudomonadales bacterium]
MMRRLTLLCLPWLLGGCLTLYTQSGERTYSEIEESYAQTMANLDDLYASCSTTECREEIERRRAEARDLMALASTSVNDSRNAAESDYSLIDERNEVAQGLSLVQEERRRMASAVSIVRDLLKALAYFEEALREEEDWFVASDSDRMDSLMLGAATLGVGTVVQGIVNGILSLFGAETAYERLQRLRQGVLEQLLYYTEGLVVETFNSIDRLTVFDTASEYVDFTRYDLAGLNLQTYAMRQDVAAIPAIGSDLGEGQFMESRQRQGAMVAWLDSIESTYSRMESDLANRDQQLMELGISDTGRAASADENLASILGLMDGLRDDSRAAVTARDAAETGGEDLNTAILCPGRL